jgi:hypothetical protein
MNAIAWNIMTTTVANKPLLSGWFNLSINSMDYHSDDDHTFREFRSLKPVRVRDGIVNTVDLIDACNSLHAQTGYWGEYIESLLYREDTNTIEVDFGS